VNGLLPATTYYFVLRTEDEVPNVSAFSNISIRTTTGGLVPDDAGRLRARAAGDVELSWQAVRAARRRLPLTGARRPTRAHAPRHLALARRRGATRRPPGARTNTLSPRSRAGRAPALASIIVPAASAGGVHAAARYPNPARDHTTIRFDLAATRRHVRVTIFD